MLQYEEYCTHHPSQLISMISLNSKIFPQRKICCQCLISCDAKNNINQNELITLEGFYKKLEQQRNQIIDLQRMKQTIFESLTQLFKQCKVILQENPLNLIQLEIDKLISQGPRPLSYCELKMFSNILIHDFQNNYKIIEDLKKSVDTVSNDLLNILKTFKDKNSINVQVNIDRDQNNTITVTIPIHKTINDLKLEFGVGDDQIYVDHKEIQNLNTTLFENNIWSNDILTTKKIKKISIKLLVQYSQQFQFQFLPSDTILTIKQQIQQQEGIDPSGQKIIYYGRVLQEFEKLQDLKLERDAIFLLDINQARINLFNIEEKPTQIRLNPNFTFENIIHEIQYHFDIPYKMISSILINNCPLQRNQQIQNLVQFQNFELTVNLSKPIILAKTLSGKIIIIESSEFETIQNIKQEIQELYNIPIGHQRLYYKNNIIDNSQSLIEIGIKQMAMLNIKCHIHKNFTYEFSIQVQSFNGFNQSILINPHFEIIKSLSKEEIVRACPSSVNFLIRGIIVKEGQCFSDFNIKKNDRIIINIKRWSLFERFQDLYSSF